MLLNGNLPAAGRDIGKLVANKLNIPCYGREILEKAAERENLSVEYVEELEEGSTGSFCTRFIKYPVWQTVQWRSNSCGKT